MNAIPSTTSYWSKQENMRIEKRVTRNTRRINRCIRSTDMLREEVNSLTEEIDDLQRKLDILWNTIRHDAGITPWRQP